MISRCAIYLIALLAFVLTLPAHPQRQMYRAYQSADGLGNPNIHTLLQDRRGFLWVGTDDGLFRFDGTDFISFGKGEGLPNSEILALAESPSGDLWVGTQGGLAVLQGRHFVRVDDGAKGGVYAIGFDRSGAMYVEHLYGIFRAEKTEGKRYVFRNLFMGQTRGLTVQGNLVLFAAGQHLWTVGAQEKMVPFDVKGLPTDEWHSIIIDSGGAIWAKGKVHLVEINRARSSVLDRCALVQQSITDRLYSDQYGNVYLSGHKGVTVLSGGKTTLLNEKHGLPTDTVGPVLMDRNGLLWIGSLGNGLLRRLGQGDWVSWGKVDGLLQSIVWAVHRTRAGTTWVGTDGGVNVLSREGRILRSITRRDGLSGEVVLALGEDASGNIIVGTEPAGVTVFNSAGRQIAKYGASDGITGERVSGLTVDHAGRLWLSGSGGLFRSTGTQFNSALHFENITTPLSAEHPSFRKVLIAPNGDILITSSRGLLRLHGDHWSTMTKSNGLRSDDLATVAVAGDTTWITYRDSLGATRLEQRPEGLFFTHYDKQRGLASDQIVTVATDNRGRVWLGSDHGIDVLESGNHIHHFGSNDGLIWDDVDGGAVEVSDSGDAWVGTSKGLSRFTPGATPPLKRSAIILTSISSGGHAWEQAEAPILPYGSNSLDLHFSTIDFTNQTSKLFRYRLLGASAGWIETSARDLHLTGLPAGRYTFEVALAGANSQYAPEVERFTFKVAAPWWQKAWFFAISTLMVAAVLTTIWKFRVHMLTRKQQWLEGEIDRRTVELCESQRKLESIAYSDVLTTLPNRRRFNEHLQGRLQQGKRFALALLDLDRFKQINDEHGHDAGDAVLVASANRFAALLLAQDDSVYRLGGDEFAILMSVSGDMHQVESLCSDLIRQTSVPIKFMDMQLTIGCSIGIAVAHGRGLPSATLYKLADSALYEAKRAGKCTFRISAENGMDSYGWTSKTMQAPCLDA